MAYKILLTGATGGIGSAIKNRLKNHELTCVARPNFAINTDGEFDWLICAHGIIDENNVLETFKANVISNIILIKTIKAKKIIFISSTAAFKGNGLFPVYSASKAALNMYAQILARERECYVIAPGPTDTEMWRKLGLEGQAQDPDEVAKVVQLVINGEFKNGQLITIRNGIVI